MNTNPDDQWLRRRLPPERPGDAWSGGGEAYRAWMAAKPRCRWPVRFGAGRGTAGFAEREWPPNPRAARSTRTRGPRDVARPPRSAVGVLLFVLTGVPLAWLGTGKRLRVCLGLGAVGLAAVVLLAPLAWAGRWHPCAAAEVALVDKAIGQDGAFGARKVRVANWTGADGRLLSHGRVGREIAAKEYAGWPPIAGCTALFWRARWEVASFDGFTAVLTRAAWARR